MEEQKAVDAGYWLLYRYDPRRKEEGKNPLVLDSKEPTGDFKDFLMGEVRYSSLTRTFPENAEVLFAKAEKDVKERYEQYGKMAAE
jgi:pyruvate-ferredoxin/flavodoxin oxidoreductase